MATATSRPLQVNNPEAHEKCPYYLKLANFSQLEAKAGAIAAQQRSIATSTISTTTSETAGENVSICSLDFLYALLASATPSSLFV